MKESMTHFWSKTCKIINKWMHWKAVFWFNSKNKNKDRAVQLYRRGMLIYSLFSGLTNHKLPNHVKRLMVPNC